MLGILFLSAILFLVHTPRVSGNCINTHKIKYTAFPSIYSAQLTIYHGRGVLIENIRFEEIVQGVAVLNLEDPMVLHLFDCSRDADGSASDLIWERENGLQRFPTSNQEIMLQERSIDTLRLSLFSADVTRGDLGVYTCIDTVSNHTISINITGGITVTKLSMILASYMYPHLFKFSSTKFS